MPADFVARAMNKRTRIDMPKNNFIFDVDVDEATATVIRGPLDIPTYTPGIPQVVTATAAGTVTADPGGTAIITVTATNMTGSPKTVDVPLLKDDDANAIALAIRTALAADATVGGFFDVSGETDKVVLTTKTAARNDRYMNIAISKGTADGVTYAPNSTNTTKGSRNEIVHPSIQFFPNGWKGYKYWLAYTPFDGMVDDWENPSMAVSNDNITWITPPGLTNPIIPQPDDGFNADPCIFMSPDEKTMYMVYKYDSGTYRSLWMTHSYDGVTWNTPVEIMSNDTDNHEFISPAVLWDGTQYVMWTVKSNTSPTLHDLYLRTADDPYGPWANPITCTYTLPSGVSVWHLDIRQMGSQYHALICAKNGINNEAYFGTSDDKTTWVFGNTPLNLLTMVGSSIYKHTMFPMITHEGLKYGVWCGSSDQNYIHYAELNFNKTKLKRSLDMTILEGLNGIGDTIFVDRFNRTDTDAGIGAPDQTPDTGVDWAREMGVNMGIASNKAYLVSATNSNWYVDLKVANFYVEVTIDVLGTSGYLLFRFTDNNNHWRYGYLTGGGLILTKKVSSVNSLYYLPAKCRAGDRLGVYAKGDNIHCYLNEKRIYTMTSTALNTATKVGLNTSNVTTRFDNFIAKSI